MAVLCPSKIRAALHDDAEVVTRIVNEEIEKSNHYALRLIPDKGTINTHNNSGIIIYGEAKQPYKEYWEKDYSLKPLVEGEMEGVNCTGKSAVFETDILDIDDNMCSGECIINFGQGFRERGWRDFDLKPKTPIVCASELAGRGPAHVRAFFKGFVDSFTRWGRDNFEANLLNFVIRYGEANASVQTADYFDVTAGAFVAPPINRMSIHFLKQYRMHMVREKALGENENLEVEMPMQDVLDAIRYHQIHKMGNNAHFEVKIYEDEDGPFRGRESVTYEGIKFYFNETPVKGYFKKVGDTYQFVRIYPWTNVAGESAGLVTRPNHAYDRSVIWCEGIKYDVVILAFYINPKSFERYGLENEYKPGEPMVSSAYQVKVLDGAWLAGQPCGNDYNELFRLIARHRFRLTMPYPEWSGAIAYLASDPQGYVIPRCAVDQDAVESQPATAAVFDTCGPTACQQEIAEACGFDGVDEDGQFIDNPPNAVAAFVPCSAATTTFVGETHQVIIRVSRTGNGVGTASVDYTITDTPESGLATSPEHYTDVSDVVGTLTWAEHDMEDKLIKLDITAASGDWETDLTATLALTNPTNLDLDADCDELVLTIEDRDPANAP